MPEEKNTPAGFVGVSHKDIDSLNNSIQNLNTTLNEFRKEIADTYVRKDVHEEQLTAIKKDIKEHDAWLDWAQRIVIGAVIIALLSLVLAQAANGGG